MHSMCYRDIVPRVQTTSNFDVQHQIPGPGGQETKRNLRPMLQHATTTNETKETYCGNMCKHMEHLETYKYETLWNHVKRNDHNMENGRYLYYQCWRRKLLSYLYPVRKHGWVMSGDHPFAMIAPPGRRGVFSQHRCMSLKFFVLTIGASEVVGRSLLQLQWHVHTRVYSKKNKAHGAHCAKGTCRTCRWRVFKPSHVSPRIYWASHLLVVDFFLEHLLPAVRFLSSPFGPVSWDVPCLLNPS